MAKFLPLVAEIENPPQKEPDKLNYPLKYADKYENGGLTSIFQLCMFNILVFCHQLFDPDLSTFRFRYLEVLFADKKLTSYFEGTSSFDAGKYTKMSL